MSVKNMEIEAIRKAIGTPQFGTKNTIYITNKPTVFIRIKEYETGFTAEPPRKMIDVPKGVVVAMGGCGKKGDKMSAVCLNNYWGHMASTDLDHYANPIYVEAPEL